MDKWILGGRKDVCIAWPGPAFQPKRLRGAQPSPAMSLPSPSHVTAQPQARGPSSVFEPSRAWKPPGLSPVLWKPWAAIMWGPS
jgi:hypothetical protein